MRSGNTTGVNLTAGTARFLGGFGGAGMGNTAAEASGAIPWPEAGTFSKLTMTVLANAITGAYNKNTRFRKNAANGNQVVTATLGTLGVVTDNSNTDAVVAGDRVGQQIQAGSGTGPGNVTYTTQGCTYVSGSSPALCVAMLGSGADVSTNLNNGETRITPPWGSLRWYALPDPVQVLDIRGYSPVLSALTVSVSANSLTASTTVRSWINAAFGNQTLTVGTGATGFFQDLSNTDYVKSGDKVAIYATTNAGAGAATFRVAMMRYADITGFQTAAGNDNNVGAAGIAITSGSTFFATIAGTYNTSTGTSETGVATPPNVSGLKAKNLQVYVSANTLVNPLVARFRKAGADGNQVVTIPAGSTGLFEDLSNVDSVGSTDAVAISYSVSSGAGSATVRKSAVTWVQPTPSRNKGYLL